MSYTKDRDRHSRGVGAIASRDLAPGAKRRFAKRTMPRVRSMGDAPTGDCSIYANGAYYVRRANGQVEKVSPGEAAKYPSCSDGSSRVAGLTPIASPTKTGPGGGGVGFSASKFSAVPVLTRPTYGSGSRPASSGPASSSVTPAAPYVVLPPATPPPPSTTPPPPPQPLPPKPLPPPTPKPPRSIFVQAAALPTTSTPAATTSVVTTWLPPVDTSVTQDTTIAPSTTPAPSSSGRNLLLLGAGIGLVYLFTRK